MRRLRYTAILMAFACVLLAISAVHASAAPRAFGSPRFQTNDTGDIAYVGNTLSTCKDDSTGTTAAGDAPPNATIGCAAGRAGAGLYNNLVPNQPINVAGIGANATANSSTSTFALPSGASVVWAGLYWGADPGSIPGNNNANPARTIQLRTPGTTAFRTITATQFDSGAPAPHTNSYQGFADVTDLVKAAGGGAYTAGGIPLFSPSVPGTAAPNDSYGGWSLVIVTKDPAQPSRNLSVFDGLVGVTNNPKVEPTINVTGFLTPPTGPVNTKLGIIAYEGDRGIQGDYAQLNGTNLGDAANPATNFFNSTQTTLGQRRSGLDPNYDNTFGYDADIFDATGRIANNATSASIKLGTTGDVYAPGVVTLATELYAPKFTPRKTVQNLSRQTGATRRGDTLRYTVSYENTGGDSAADMRIDDQIPANTTYLADSLQITGPNAAVIRPSDAAGDDAGEYVAGSRTVRFRPGTGGSATAGGTVAVNQTATVTFDVVVGAGLADNTRIDNVATASYRAATSGTGFTDLPTPTTSTLVRAPDLQIAKTITSGPITAGQPAQFALSVTNAGGAPTDPTDPIVVTDTVPAGAFPNVRGASGQGWTCTVTGQVVRCVRTVATAADALAGGAGYPPILVDVTAANNLPNPVLNSATVAGGGDSDTTNNTGTATGPGTNRADLNVSKRFDRSTAIVGDTVRWTMEVRNDGPSDATGATLSDPVAGSGLTVTSATSSRGGANACTLAIACTFGTIPSGENAVVTVTATVTGAPRTITNTATAQSTVPDPSAGNNTSSAQLTVVPSADLSITKTGPATAPNAGAQAYSFELTVRNTGPNDAQNVSVLDQIPANFAVTGVTTTGGGGLVCERNAQRVACTSATFPVGATATVTISGTSAAGGLVTNSATVDATTVDPDGSNNSATAAVQVGTLADLSIVKTFSATDAVATGARTTVSLAITNGGPSGATGVVARDTLPASLRFISSADGCTVAGQDVSCPVVGNLASGNTSTRTFIVEVNAGASGTATNTATVSTTGNGAVADPFPGNNTSTARLGITNIADMAVTNTANVATANVGDTVTWTVTGTNNGTSPATNPRFTVQLPAGVTGIAITSGAADCTLNAAARTVTCRRATLANGASIPVTFTGVVGDELANTTLLDPATVTSDTGDPNTANNAAQASVQINPAYRLTVDKTARDTTVAPNQATTFDIAVRNAGPSDAPTVTVTDTLPAGTVFVSADAGCAVDGGVVTCTIPRIAANTTATRTIIVRTTSTNAGTTITNSARYATNDPEDIDKNKNQPANSDSATVAVTTIADLQVTNVATPTSASVGETVSWTVVGRNNGPSPAVNPSYTVTLPAGVTGLAITSNSPSCSITGQVVTCAQTTPLASGAEIPVTFTGTIGRQLAGTTVTDPAVIKSDTADPAPDNNTATASVAIARRYELSVDKTARDTAVNPGATTTFDLKITNAGPNDAPGVNLVDRLPTGTTFESASAGCTNTLGTVTCVIGTVPANTSVTREVTVRTLATTSGTTITNTLGYTAPDGQAIDVNKNNPVLASDTASVNVNADADLAITNTVTPATANVGDTATWTVTGTNNGPVAAVNPRFTASLPAGVTDITITSGAADCTVNQAARTVTCARTTLAPNGTIPVTFTGVIGRQLAGTTVDVPATITADTGDLRPANNSATSSLPIGRRYEMTVDKTARDTTVTPSATTTFDLKITNTGPNDATGVVLIDTLPAGTTFVSGDQGCAVLNGVVRCQVGALASGASATRAILVRTSNANAGTTISNVLTYETADPVTVDVNRATPAGTDTATVAVSANADLALTNTADVQNAVVGQTVTWNVVGRNNGPSTAVNPRFTVTLPDGVTGIRVTDNSVDCTANQANRTVTCTRTTLAPGDTIDTTFVGVIGRSLAGTTVLDPGTIVSDTPDLTQADNSATASVQIGSRYELSVDKTARTPAVQPGDTATFDLKVTNAGPNSAPDVTLVDTLPPNTTFVSADPGCTQAAGVVRCAIASVAANTTETRTVTIQTSGANSGDTLTNQLGYETPATNTVDVNKGTAASRDTADVTVAARADLAVTITPRSPTAVVGGQATWDVVGTNLGPDTADDPTFTVPLPAGVSNIQVTGTGCAVQGQVVTCNRDSLAPNGTITAVITGTIDRSAAGGPIQVPASIASPTTVDPDPTNNRATSTITVGRRYELSVEKTADQSRVGPSQDITYTLKITNNGPNQATGVDLVDPLPANTTLVSATQGCTVAGTTVTCPVGTLAAGDSATRQITVRTATAAAGTTVTNSATYTTPDGPAVDVNRGTPAATGTASVQVTPLVDLGITKSVTPGRVTAGGEVVYTLDVVNNGPNGATGVVVDDALPDGLTVLQTAPTQGTCSVNGRAVRCVLGAIAAGGRAQVIIRARADSAGTVVNKAGVTSDQAESNPTDNTSSEVPLVIDPAPVPAPNPDPAPGPGPAPGPQPAPAVADLVLSKVLINKTIEVGRILTYRITVTNKGTGVAKAVRVTDVPSRTLQILGVKPTVGTCPGRSPITCNLGDLAPGQSAQITVSARASTPGKLSNAATAVATGSPEVPAETAVADTSVRRVASSIAVTKTVSRSSVRGGSSVKFSIRVRNFSRKTVRKVSVCDTLPRGLVFQKASPLKVVGRKACGTIAALKPGQVRTFVVTVRAESRTKAKTLRNTVRAIVPGQLSTKASRAVRVLPGPGATGNGGVTG